MFGIKILWITSCKINTLNGWIVPNVEDSRLNENPILLKIRKLYKKSYEVIYLKFLGREEAREVLGQYYDKYDIGNGSKQVITHYILRLGYFLETIFKDSFEHVHFFHTCQTRTKKERNLAMSLQLVFEVHPFSM